MQFGTPITIINGGIKAMRIESLYPTNAMLPMAQTTEIKTTMLQIKIAFSVRKKKKINAEVTSNESPMNQYISL
jgi:hypothetical protein